MQSELYIVLGSVVIVSPAILLAVLGIASLIDHPLSERATARLTQGAVVSGLLASLAILGLMLFSGSRHVTLELGNWVSIPEQHFHFHIKFIFDRLSVPFVILSFVLVGVVGAFANVYLHRDAGYRRFFVLYAMFLIGMVYASAAGTIETLFAGWELVGLSSAMLVAFFQERVAPVRNGMRIWTVYRLADAAFLIAALSLHHSMGEGDFDVLIGRGIWPLGHATMPTSAALFIGFLLLIAAAGKSALIPFSGWLPRAMEGPTPSSAIFYGALSIHLGAFLLLRISPILEDSLILSSAVVVLGIASALLAFLSARVQTDAKSALAYASLTQVGIIVAEIGLGFRYLALAHIIGHACLRTLQLLRAPSLLRDYRTLENAIGLHLTHATEPRRPFLTETKRIWFWRFGTERGYLDALLDDYVVRPFLALFGWFTELECRCSDFLQGAKAPPPEVELPHTEIFGMRRNGSPKKSNRRPLQVQDY